MKEVNLSDSDLINQICATKGNAGISNTLLDNDISNNIATIVQRGIKTNNKWKAILLFAGTGHSIEARCVHYDFSVDPVRSSRRNENKLYNKLNLRQLLLSHLGLSKLVHLMQ